MRTRSRGGRNMHSATMAYFALAAVFGFLAIAGFLLLVTRAKVSEEQERPAPPGDAVDRRRESAAFALWRSSWGIASRTLARVSCAVSGARPLDLRLLAATALRRLLESRAISWALAGVLLVLGVALVIRLVGLDSVPVNLTADEGDFLQNVYHVLAGTGPGPFGFDWTPSPALVGVYLMAALVKVFGASIFGLRMYPVLLSTATLIPFFLLARTRLSYAASLLATLLLATSLWYLHFSRTAWTNMNGDLFAVSGALMLTLAIERDRWYYYVGAGVFAALGIYGYFSARLIPLFFLAYLPVALFLFPDRRRRVLIGYGVLALTCLIVFAPQMKPIVDRWDTFNRRAEVTSILNKEGPYLGDTELGWKLVHQTERALRAFILIDGSDEVMRHGLWARYVPPDRGLLDGATRLLFFLGLLVGLWRWRATALWWLMFLGPVLSIQVFTTGTPDAARGLIVAPFMFLFVGAGLDLLLGGARLLARNFAWPQTAAPVALLALVVPIAVINVREYYDWMHSDRAIAARNPAVTREEFPEWQRLQREAAEEGEFGFTVSQWRKRQDEDGCLTSDLPPILCREEDIADSGAPADEEEAALAPESRDQRRRQDLAEVAAALDEYVLLHESYPDTGGDVQTLCAYEEFDAGCALSTVLDPLPSDPLAAGGDRRYWYSSDGGSFVLYAALEVQPASLEEDCPKRPPHLAKYDFLFCVSSAR